MSNELTLKDIERIDKEHDDIHIKESLKILFDNNILTKKNADIILSHLKHAELIHSTLQFMLVQGILSDAYFRLIIDTKNIEQMKETASGILLARKREEQERGPQQKAPAQMAQIEVIIEPINQHTKTDLVNKLFASEELKALARKNPIVSQKLTQQNQKVLQGFEKLTNTEKLTFFKGFAEKYKLQFLPLEEKFNFQDENLEIQKLFELNPELTNLFNKQKISILEGFKKLTVLEKKQFLKGFSDLHKLKLIEIIVPVNPEPSFSKEITALQIEVPPSKHGRMSLKLFSLINNDAHLEGTRNLEGENFRHTISSLSEFIRESSPKEAQLTDELFKIIHEEKLLVKLEKMVEIEDIQEKLINKLEPLPEELRKQIYLDEAKSIAKDILALKDKPNSILFPGGWNGIPSGHAMIYEFKKDKEGNLLFLVHNSGSGLKYHKTASTQDKERHHSIKAYQIPKASLTEDNLCYFIAELLKPTIEPLIHDATLVKNCKFDAKRLYLEVFPKIAYLNAQEIDINDLEDRLKEIITIGQRSGSCTEKALHEMIKSAMPDTSKAKQLIFFYKRYSIIRFFHENQQSMDSKKGEQIILAIENLARIIEKDPSLFSDETIQDTYIMMEKIKSLLSTYEVKHQNKQVSFSLDSNLISPQIVTIEDHGVSLSINKIEDKTHISFHEQINIQPLLSETFSQDKFNIFIGEVKIFIKENDFQAAKQSIENLLLNIPLNSEYYATIDDAFNGPQFINALTEIINLYGICCEKLDPACKFGAKTIITLLSVMGIINEVTALKNTVTVRTLLPLMSLDFTNLINSLIHNPFLATKDSATDARLLEICERNTKISSLASLTHFKNYDKKQDRILYYKDFIQKHPQSNQLNEFLLELFKQYANKKFKKEEITIINSKNNAPEIALLCLLDKDILKRLTPKMAEQAKNLKIAEIDNKLKLERECEQLSSNIFTALHYFSYWSLHDKNKDPLISFDQSKNAIIYNSLLNFLIYVNAKSSQETLTDKNLIEALNLNFGHESTSRVKNLIHPNSIYCNNAHIRPLKDNMNEKAILECQTLRSMWLLRSSPKTQILNTLDYFKQNPQILKNKDYLNYLSLNIFQPGLIDEGLNNIPEFFSSVNTTLEYLIDYYKNDTDESYVKEMFTLSYLFNQYVLNSIIKKEMHNAELILNKLKETLVSKKSEMYNELHLCIQMDLFKKDQEKGSESELMNSLTALLSCYMDYTTYYHAREKEDTASIKKHEELQYHFIQLVAKHKKLLNEVVYNWLVKQYPQNEWLYEGRFPSYILHDKRNSQIICLDLTSGTLWENGQKKGVLAVNLSNSPIYIQFFNAEQTKQAKSSLVSYPKVKGTFRQYILETKTGKATFFETPHLKKPYVLHITKSIENKERQFELINILSADDPSSGTSDLGSREIKLNLPKTFFCESTHSWCEVNNQNMLIERKNEQYLLDASGILHELDKHGHKNGFMLLNLKSLSAKDPLLSLYNNFSEFENRDMIEVYVNPMANVGENQIKISFPRYGLTLHGRWDLSTKEWIITDPKHPTRVLCQDQTSPIVGYEAALFFQDSVSNEVFAYAPMQDFYVRNTMKQKHESEETYPTVYYQLSTDISNEAKNKLLESEEKLLVNPKSPWHYVDSESFITLNYDQNTKDFKTSSTQDGLFLAYVNLCQHKPEKSLCIVQEIINSTGLKGTIEELALIEKIINGTPRFPEEAAIKNPAFIAVKAQVLSLLVHYLAKGHPIPTPTLPRPTTKAELIAYLENERLKAFQSDLDQHLFKMMNAYHHTQMNIPREMKLLIKQEYELLQFLFGKTDTPTGALGIRYHELKKAKFKKDKIVKFSDIIPQTEIILSLPTEYHHTSHEITISELTTYFSARGGYVTLPYPGISDKLFARNFSHYFTLAKSEENDQKRQLRRFCENTIRAHSALDEGSRDSLLYTFSIVLLRVMQDPYMFDDKDVDQLDILFKKASTIPIQLRGSIFGLLHTEKMICYKPSAHKPLIDSLKVTPSGFSFPELDDRAYRKEANIDALALEIEKLDQQMQAKINTLIEKKYSEGEHYLEKEKMLAKLDDEIGKLYHENHDIIKAVFKKYLTSASLRKHISSITDHKLASIQPLRAKITQEMLMLVRKGPSNANQKLIFQLQQLGRTKKLLDINDLQRLYVLSDLNEYQQATGLSFKEINLLHQKISDYVQLSILEQQYHKRKKALLALEMQKLDDTLLNDLGSVLTETNVCDFATEPQMQFFQMAQGMLIYPSRKEFIQELLKPDSQNIIVQPKMGGGKTKVISPLVNVCKADGKKLVIYQVKKSLFETNYQDANATSLKLFNQEAIPFEFDRNSPSSSSDLKLIYRKLQQTIINKNYLITTGDSLKALELKYVELLFMPAPLSNKSEHQEWQKQIKWLEKSLQLIKYAPRLIDEVHEELDPKKRLNYTLGKPDHVIADDIQLQVKFFEFLSMLSMNDGQAFANVLTGKTSIKDPIVMSTTMAGIADMLTTSAQSPIHLIVQKLNCNRKQQKALAEYLLDKNDSIKIEFNQLNSREKDDLAFLKLQLSSILPHTLSRNLFEHYGPSFNQNKSVIEKHLPIPYADNNTPNENSEFGHFIENMNYAIQMAYQRGFSDEFVDTILNQFIEQAEFELIELPTLPFNRTFACIQFREQFKDLDLYQIKYNEHYRQNAITKLKANSNFMKYALANHVLGRILINPLVIESNAVNGVSMTKATQGMTGTPYNVRAMHRKMRFNEKSGLGIDGQTTELIKRKKPDIIPLKPFTTISDFLKQNQDGPEVRAIIDVGALFKGISNEQVAKELADFYKTDPNIKYILYFDTIHKKLYALNIKEKKSILLNTTDEKLISKILSCQPDERFTYYDQASSTGIDIVQGKRAKAIVTLANKTTRSKLYQGFRRMRQLDDEQTISIAFPNDLKDKPAFASGNVMGIIDYTKENEINEMLELHLMGCHQNFQDIIRTNLLDKIYTTSSIDEKAMKLKLFKQYFISEYQPNHYIQSGNLTTLEKSEIYFTKLENETYLNWEKLLKDANYPITSEESAAIKNELALLKATAIAICDKLIKSKGLSQEVGRAVEIENKTTVATHIENNTKLAIDLKAQQLLPYLWVSVNSATDQRPKDLIGNINALPSVNKKLSLWIPNLPFLFSDRLYFSESYAQTYLNQSAYFDLFTKPIQTIMMVSKKEPLLTTTAIIMNSNEAELDLYNDLSNANRRVWFVNPAGTLLGGNPPQDLPTDYYTLLEQIRYLNGDCSLLVSQKEVLQWIDDEKLDFFKNNILPIHLDQSTHFNKLKARTSILNKIMRKIIGNASDDFRYKKWELEFPGYSKLSDREKNLILQLSIAYHQMNQLNFVPSREWMQSFPLEIASHIKYRFKELEFIGDISNALQKGKKLRDIFQDNKYSVKSFLYSINSLLNHAIAHYHFDDLDFLLENGLLDRLELNTLDVLIKAYEKDIQATDTMLKMIVKGSHYLGSERKQDIIIYLMKSNQKDLAKRLLVLFAIAGYDLISKGNNEFISYLGDLSDINDATLSLCRNIDDNSSRFNIEEVFSSVDLENIRIADLNLFRSDEGFTFLEIILNSKSEDFEKYIIIAKLLPKGLDLNIPFSNGQSPLMQTIKSNNIRLRNYLIGNGANINYCTAFLSPIQMAYDALGNTYDVKSLNEFVYLIKKGTKTDNFLPKKGYHTIQNYAFNIIEDLQKCSFNDFLEKLKNDIEKHLVNNEPILSIFERYGRGWFDFNYLTAEGKTPLQSAIVDMNLENIVLLLNHDIDFNLQDGRGKNTYDYLLDLINTNFDDALQILPLFVKYAPNKFLFNQNIDQNIFLQALKKNNMDLFNRMAAWCAFRMGTKVMDLDNFLLETLFQEKHLLSLYQQKNTFNFQFVSNIAIIYILHMHYTSPTFISTLNSSLDNNPLLSNYVQFYIHIEHFKPILHCLANASGTTDEKIGVINKFIKLGFDINYRDEDNATILDLAIKNNDIQLVQYLLENKAIYLNEIPKNTNPKILAMLLENKEASAQKRQHFRGYPKSSAPVDKLDSILKHEVDLIFADRLRLEPLDILPKTSDEDTKAKNSKALSLTKV